MMMKKKTEIPADSLSSKKRVLHIITRMIRGGAQKNTLATLCGLRAKGYQVTLVTGPSSGREGDILPEVLAEGLEVIIIPELVRDIHPLKDILAFYKLWKLMGEKRYGLVHTHTSKAGILGRLAAWLRKVPVIVHTPHGHVFHSYFPAWKEKIFMGLEYLYAMGTTGLIALTDRCQQEHLALGIGHQKQWTVIPSGVPKHSMKDYSVQRREILAELKISDSRKIIGFVGRFAPVKGVHDLIQALVSLYWAQCNFHCILVGDGEQREELEELVSSIHLKGRVTFVGGQKDVAKFLSILDVLVVPSLNEGMGRVIVEAGLLRKPVIATSVGGIPDLIENDRTGLLVPRCDPRALASAMLYVFENPARAQEWAEALHQKVLQGYTEPQMIEKIHQFYEKLLFPAGRSQNADLEEKDKTGCSVKEVPAALLRSEKGMEN